MRALFLLLALLAVLYAALGLLLYLFQGSMVYLANLPGRSLDATPRDIGLEFEDVYIETSDRERLHGWYVPAADPRGVLLFFHGNAGNISHRLESIRIFHQLQLDVLIVDYRGYGQSSGRPSEQGTYRDAAAAWDYLTGQRGVEPGRIHVFGRSLGGAVGAWLVSQLPPPRQPAGVIIESSFSSGPDMARRIYPIFPSRLLTRLRYPVLEYARSFRCPALVVHSRDDEIIPFMMGQAIYEAISSRKAFVELRGDHNSGFWISRDDYVAGLERFLQSSAQYR